MICGLVTDLYYPSHEADRYTRTQLQTHNEHNHKLKTGVFRVSKIKSLHGI